MNIKQIVAAVPDYQFFFSPDAMLERTDCLHQQYPASLTRTVLGKSRFGAEIEMITMGHGKYSVMIVGAPHPHELVGTMTADFLMTRFCEQPALLESTNATWHFIKMIDPDGVQLNSGWLGQPLSLSDYFSSFFRPPLWRQAEFTFPFIKGEHRFSDSTPENHAWKKALLLTKPDLLYSTHNCEFGGVFYFTSDGLPELDRELMHLTRQFHLTEDTTGEYGAIPKPDLPGIFAFPDEIEESIREQFNDKNHLLMPTGDSSAGYSEKKFGTFSLIAEVPYWRLAKREADIDVADVIRKTNALKSDGEKLADKFLPLLQNLTSRDALLLLEALLVPKIDHAPQNEKVIDNCYSALADYLLAMRRPSMLCKLTEIAWKVDKLPDAENMFCEVQQFHRQSINAIEDMHFLAPVPLRELVQLQAEAALISLKHLQTDHRGRNSQN